MTLNKQPLPCKEAAHVNHQVDCTTSSVAEAVRMTCAALKIDHDVADTVVAGTVARLRTAVSFADIEAAVSSALPNVHFTRNLNVHPESLCRAEQTSLAQAQEAAAAIIAEYGGTVETRYFPKHSCQALGDVKVVTHGIDIGIFFHSEETPTNDAH